MASVAQHGDMSSVKRLSLPVEGMTCASCVGRVERALKAVPGVQTAVVNLATERADMSFAGLPDPQAAVRAIESAGYSVREETTELAIEDMTCASCVGRVEKALAQIPGVLEATVNLATERARVRHLAGSSPRLTLKRRSNRRVTSPAVCPSKRRLRAIRTPNVVKARRGRCDAFCSLHPSSPCQSSSSRWALTSFPPCTIG